MSTLGNQELAIWVSGATIPEIYLTRIQVQKNDRAFMIKVNGKYQNIMWNEVHPKMLGIFASLKKHGLQKGDRACIASQTRFEWFLCDVGIQCAGGVTVPIYHSSSLEDTAFILKDCDAKIIFVDDQNQIEKVTEALKLSGKNIPVVSFNPVPAKKYSVPILSFDDFSRPSPESDDALRKQVAEIKGEDIFSIVYTSGTTGTPKGAVLTQSNMVSEVLALSHFLEIYRNDLSLSFLPCAHIYGRLELCLPILAGINLGYAESINTVSQDIQLVKPTLFLGVPRIYEKIFAKIQSEVAASPTWKQNVFKWALNTGKEIAGFKSRREAIPTLLGLKYKVADKLVFSKIREKLGGRVRIAFSAGAPLSPELCQVFHACGIFLLEGYGLTETSGVVVINRPTEFEFSTVGPTIPGVQVRIAPDGEVQTKGSVNFREYYRNAAATKEAFTEDGWFCTGDIGEFTARGNLKITDRKKELIVTSGGKKVAPQKIENMIKTSRFLSNGMVYGDKQKYLVALLTLNEPEVKSWAAQLGVNGSDIKQLAENDKVNELVNNEIKSINSNLASFESIKKFHILPVDFTVESGELTPSLKLKRKVVVQKYKQDIDQMYT